MITLQTGSPLVHQSLDAHNKRAHEFAREASEGDLVLDAPYQRGSVWTLEQRRNLVRSWLMGLPVPAVIVNARWESFPDVRTGGGPGFAVVDGKQRIEAAIAWFDGTLDVPATWFDPAWVAHTHETADGPYVTSNDLTPVGQRFTASRFMLPTAVASVATVQEEATIFGLVNGAGTAQSDDDMDRAARIAGGQSAPHSSTPAPPTEAQVQEAARRLTPLLTEDGDWLVDPEGAQFHHDIGTLLRAVNVEPVEHRY